MKLARDIDLYPTESVTLNVFTVEMILRRTYLFNIFLKQALMTSAKNSLNSENRNLLLNELLDL